MKIQHREWTIDSVPQKQGRLWHACVEVERGPWEHESLGQIYHFIDIGHYDTVRAAEARGIEWAKVWLDSNFEALA